MAEQKVIPIKAEPPTEMGREDRRVIFARVSDVYLDEKRGYSDGWTDNRVAQDLGVPRVWVSKVRDEMFGPVGHNEDVSAFLTKVNDLKDEIQGAAEKAAALLREADKIKKSLGLL